MPDTAAALAYTVTLIDYLPRLVIVIAVIVTTWIGYHNWQLRRHDR